MSRAGKVRMIRGDLDMTQGEFAQLLGVHQMTVAKWEWGKLSPIPYHCAMMDAFHTAVCIKPNIRERALYLLSCGGVASATFALLDVVYGKNGRKRVR